MNINASAWETVTKELMIIGKAIETDPNTTQAFFDAATTLHTMFHVAQTFVDTGKIVQPYNVICECEELPY